MIMRSNMGLGRYAAFSCYVIALLLNESVCVGQVRRAASAPVCWAWCGLALL